MTDELREWGLSPDRYFSAHPSQRALARRLYNSVKELPLVCPHGHVDPALLADPDARFGTPADLFIIPDHYILRMLYSQGVPMEQLGVSTRDGSPVETDHRRIWQTFADHFYLFRGTPSGMWLTDELVNVFGVGEKLSSDSAQRIYDHLEEQLAKPEFTPRALFQRFRIETLCTTDAAADSLAHHEALREEGWGTSVRPTFRPDAVVNLTTPGWRGNIEALSEASRIDVRDYRSFLEALRQRRAFFQSMGATATDHAALVADTEPLDDDTASKLFERALAGTVTSKEATRFTAHMLMEMARMSDDDGLVMQLHIGSMRNHNRAVYERFGLDMGADIPVATEWTRGLRPLLNEFGTDATFRLIVMTLDESTYGRELAPLAGHYPALRLGPPWWFFDSVNGMRRFLDQVVETAGIYNTAGFNDDTRAFTSIPARHDMWRRVTCNWLAGLVVQGLVDEEDAAAMAVDLAYCLSKQSYNLNES